MHKKTYNDMGAAMVKYKNKELNLDDPKEDIIFKESELVYTKSQEKAVRSFFAPKNISYN